MKHLEQAVDVILAVWRPFVPIHGQKSDIREQLAAVLGSERGGFIGALTVPRDVVEQAFDEGAELRVCCRPVASRVGLNALVEMAKRLREVKVLEKLVHLIVYSR